MTKSTKSTKTHHYTYIIRHVNGRYYVGRRSTKKDPLLDPYMGSGKWVKSIKDKTTLTKTIIAYHDTFDELKVAEFELIEKYFLDEYCMNMLYSSCGVASGDKHPNFGKTGELSPNYGDKNGMYGKNHTEQSKKLMSDANSGEKNPNFGKTGALSSNSGKTGELSPRFGTTHTKETKQLMSNNHADFSGDKNPMYGKIGELHPRYGGSHTKEARKKMSDARSGEKCHKATITEATVKLILIRIAEGVKDRAISEEYNTTVAVVSGIRSGRNWKHVMRDI